MNRKYSYDDILLTPRYSTLESRSKADTSVEFLGRKFKLPVIPANMESVINGKLAKALSEKDYFYIYHRFGKTETGSSDIYNFLCLANEGNWKLISISAGVHEPEFDLKCWSELRVDYLTIDVAHAHHQKVKERLSLLKKIFPDTKIIAGNVCTAQAVNDLIKWGADAIKVGVGQGSICTTRHQTGFSYPMFSCIKECCSDTYLDYNDYSGIPQLKYRPPNIPIIADGGIKHIGDIAKALTAGATMVMSGLLFASCIDSPAHIVEGKKEYYGSTSFEAKKNHEHIEGKLIAIPFDVTYETRLKEIQMALQSAISYAGGNNLNAFKKVDWINI